MDDVSENGDKGSGLQDQHRKTGQMKGRIAGLLARIWDILQPFVESLIHIISWLFEQLTSGVHGQEKGTGGTEPKDQTAQGHTRPTYQTTQQPQYYVQTPAPSLAKESTNVRELQAYKLYLAVRDMKVIELRQILSLPQAERPYINKIYTKAKKTLIHIAVENVIKSLTAIKNQSDIGKPIRKNAIESLKAKKEILVELQKAGAQDDIAAKDKKTAKDCAQEYVKQSTGRESVNPMGDLIVAAENIILSEEEKERKRKKEMLEKAQKLFKDLASRNAQKKTKKVRIRAAYARLVIGSQHHNITAFRGDGAYLVSDSFAVSHEY